MFAPAPKISRPGRIGGIARQHCSIADAFKLSAKSPPLLKENLRLGLHFHRKYLAGKGGRVAIVRPCGDQPGQPIAVDNDVVVEKGEKIAPRFT